MMTDLDLDVAVIGAGFAGLAALHLLRERGLRVRAYDEAHNVGGTWWWHAFPGSHLDTESHLYQYFFAEQLYRDWGWSERHPAGYEVQRWLRFAADRLDLRRDIRLSTRVVEAVHDGCWTVRTDRGETVRARYLVACTGRLPVEPDVDVSGFGGLVVRTAAWPEDGHDLSRRRVGIVGTPTATIQLAPAVADAAAELTVVADGPRDVVLRTNPLYGWRERDAYKARFAELRDSPVVEPPGPDREAMRARLGDDRLAPLLVPDGEAGRVVLDGGWLELFARDDVRLVGQRRGGTGPDRGDRADRRHRARARRARGRRRVRRRTARADPARSLTGRPGRLLGRRRAPDDVGVARPPGAGRRGRRACQRCGDADARRPQLHILDRGPDAMTYEVRPVGHVESVLRDHADAPRQADEGAPDAWLVLDPALREAAADIAPGDELVVITWLHEADRDVLVVHPRSDPSRPPTGVFSTRSPARPNPLGLHTVRVLDVDGTRIHVDALEAVDGTPVVDVKPTLTSRR